MSKTIKFTKMHGIGNDFVIIDARAEDLKDISLRELATQMCDRHFGIGADGLVLIHPSQKASLKMQIFNPDSSEPEMCGNGIRCFARYVYEHTDEKDRKDLISVETLAGILMPAVILEGDEIKTIEVDMGEPRLLRSQVPMVGKEDDQVLEEELKVNGQSLKITAVSMGNPHCVIFMDDLSKINLADIGPKIETHLSFPESTNVEFAKVINKNEVESIVWERGAGITLACGTGACAVAVAGVLLKKLDRKSTIKLPGGSLEIEWDAEDNHVYMRGPAEEVFRGEYTYEAG